MNKFKSNLDFVLIERVDCDALEIIYFYHPDYLGSVEFVTDMRGEPYQPVRRSLGEGGFLLNTPWADQAFRKSPVGFYREGASLSRWQGNYYYGARYYDPKISVWLSVDRMASKYPHMSPYNFSGNNPINLTDPNGDSLKATQEAWDYTLLGLNSWVLIIYFHIFHRMG